MLPGASLLTQEGHKRPKGLKGQKGCCGHRVGGLDEIRGGEKGSKVHKEFERELSRRL